MFHSSKNILALATLTFIRERMVEVKWVLPPDIASHLSITCTFLLSRITFSLFSWKDTVIIFPFLIKQTGDNSLISWKALKALVHHFCVLNLIFNWHFRFSFIFGLVKTLEMFSPVIKRLPLGIDVCGCEEKLHHELFKRSRCTSACINCINCILPPIEFEIFENIVFPPNWRKTDPR